MPVALGVLCLLVAISDLLFRRVPNAVIVAGLLLQALALSVGGLEPPLATGWAQALAGLALAAVFLPLWRWRVMGAGDVKFLMLIGFCTGMGGLVLAWLVGSVIAGLHALWRVWFADSAAVAYLVAGLALRYPWYRALGDRLATWRAGRGGAPYAAFLAVGVALLVYR